MPLRRKEGFVLNPYSSRKPYFLINIFRVAVKYPAFNV
jgi:hypothetical protein